MELHLIKQRAEKCLQVLNLVVPLVVSAINAPSQVMDVSIQLKALEQCINLFLTEASSPDSILSQFGSQELAGLGGLLSRLDGTLQQTRLNVETYVVILPTSQRRAWKDTFSSVYQRLRWTWDGKGIASMIQQLRSDCELINSLILVIQTRAMSDTSRALGNMENSLGRIDSRMDYVIELLHHLVNGPRDSLHEMFGMDGDDDSGGDLPPCPPGYAQSSEARASIGLQSVYTMNSEGTSNTRIHNSGNGPVATRMTAETMMVTAQEFLWRLAKQAALENPWEIKIRFHDDFDDKSTAEHYLSNCCGTLMELSHAGRENEWKEYSIQSWLYSAAWYLSSARIGLKLGNDGHDMSLVIESFISLVKVYWILLIIDQHPQKPTEDDCGQDHRRYEQLQALASAFSAEIRNADCFLGRQPIKVISETLENHVGSIWSSSDWTPASHEKDMFLAGFATSILEHPPLSVVAMKPVGNNVCRGKYVALCRNCLFILPKAFNHLCWEVPFLACGCADGKHLSNLKRLTISGSTTWSFYKSNQATINFDGVTEDGRSEDIDVVLQCQDPSTAAIFVEQLNATSRREDRLEKLTGQLGAWPIQDLKVNRETRLVRSPYDNAAVGTKFLTKLTQFNHKKHRRTIMKEIVRLQTPREAMEGLRNASIFDSLWSFFDRPKRFTVTETVQVEESDDEMDEAMVPIPKPPDCTHDKVISPLTVILQSGAGSSMKLHIISPKTRFEIGLLVSNIAILRQYDDTVRIDIYENSKRDKKPTTFMSTWSNKADIEDMYRTIALFRSATLCGFKPETPNAQGRTKINIGGVAIATNFAIYRLVKSNAEHPWVTVFWMSNSDECLISLVSESGMLEPQQDGTMELPATTYHLPRPPQTTLKQLGLTPANIEDATESLEAMSLGPSEAMGDFRKLSASSIRGFAENFKTIFTLIVGSTLQIHDESFNSLTFEPQKHLGIAKSSKSPAGFKLSGNSLMMRLWAHPTSGSRLQIFAWSSGEPTCMPECPCRFTIIPKLSYEKKEPARLVKSPTCMKSCACIFSSAQPQFKVKGNKMTLRNTTFKPFDEILERSLPNGEWKGDFILEFSSDSHGSKLQKVFQAQMSFP